MAPVKAIVFDSNETLLDLRALDPHFAAAFGDAAVRERWFKRAGELFRAVTVAGEYRNFERLSDVALLMVAEQLGRDLAKADRAAIHEAVLTLPVHADVRRAPAPLRQTMLKLAMLPTLDAPEAARETLERVQAVHHGYCPVHRSTAAATAITTEYRSGVTDAQSGDRPS